MDNNQTFQIGDTIYITDKQSNMYGKKGVLLVKTSDHYIVTINDNNQRYKTIVPIGYVSHEEPTIIDNNMAYGGGIYGLEIGDSVTWKNNFTRTKRKGIIIDIDKDGKYISVRNSNGGIDYLPIYEVEKYETGGGVDNDVWEKYRIQDKHGYVSYFDDKENALKFLKENEGSFAISWDDTEQPLMAKGGSVGKTVYSLDQIQYDIEYKNNEGDTYSETFNSKDEALKEIFRLEKLGYIVTSRQRSFKDDGTFNGYFAKGGTTKQQKKVAKVMHEFKEGELHSGKSGKVVTDPKQAIAIALSESQKMEQGGNLPYTYSLIRKWSDNMVTDADIDSVIEAMIKAKITDADLVTPPTKTGTQFTKAKEKLNNEIFKKIQGVYVGNLKGNQPYGIIATMVDRATRFDDKTIAEYKKQKTATKSGWKHKKTAKA